MICLSPHFHRWVLRRTHLARFMFPTTRAFSPDRTPRQSLQISSLPFPNGCAHLAAGPSPSESFQHHIASPFVPLPPNSFATSSAQRRASLSTTQKCLAGAAPSPL